MREKCKSLNAVSANDDTRWFVQLVDKNMKELYKIFLYIPRDFPNAPPQITVSDVLDHPWVNQDTKVVQHPLVISWNAHNELGAILMDVLREFTTKKPRVVDNDSRLRRTSVQSSASQSSPSIIEIVAMPSIPPDFPELKELPLEVLEDLDKEPARLGTYIDSMELMTKYRTMTRMAREETLLVAKEGLIAQGLLDHSEQNLQSVLADISKLRAEFEESLQERDSIMSHYTPNYLLRDLSVLADQMDTQSAHFIESFERDEESRNKYLQQRILYHKAMALSELLTVHSGSRALGSPRGGVK
jgi:hypothetical protein